MGSALAVFIVTSGLFLAWHQWLVFHHGRPFSTSCACGHAAAFHANEGGCRHTHDRSVDCYGYCTCQRTVGEVEGALKR